MLNFVTTPKTLLLTHPFCEGGFPSDTKVLGIPVIPKKVTNGSLSHEGNDSVSCHSVTDK